MATVSGGGGGDGYGSLPGITDSAPHATLQASTADSYQLHAADAELESGPYASLVASEVTQSSPAKSTSTHSAPGQSRSSSGATSGDRGKGGVCPGFGGADGNLRFILMVSHKTNSTGQSAKVHDIKETQCFAVAVVFGCLSVSLQFCHF